MSLHQLKTSKSMIAKRNINAAISKKEASRLYAELCEPMLKFFIVVSWNEPDH